MSGYGNNKPHPQQHVRLHLASKLSATATATASASAEGLLLFFSQLSVHKTLTHIHSSGVIACLRANRSLSLILYLGTVLLSYTLMLSYCIFFLLLDSAELALKAAHAALSGGISVVSPFFFFTNFSFISFIN